MTQQLNSFSLIPLINGPKKFEIGKDGKPFLIKNKLVVPPMELFEEVKYRIASSKGSVQFYTTGMDNIKALLSFYNQLTLAKAELGYFQVESVTLVNKMDEDYDTLKASFVVATLCSTENFNKVAMKSKFARIEKYDALRKASQ